MHIPHLRFLTVAGVLILALFVFLIPSCRRKPIFRCEPCCGPSAPEPCVNPDGVCCYASFDNASVSEMREMFTSSSLSVMYGPAVHPILDSSGSELEAWYDAPPQCRFVSPSSFDSAASIQLDAQNPANRHIVLRSTRTPAEWQAWLDTAPAGTRFEGDLRVRYQVDTLVEGSWVFDPFTILWELQSTDPGQRTFVGSSTTSMARYFQGRITGRLWNLADSDFDSNPDPRRNQLENKLDQITAKAETRDYQTAVSQIDADILSRMDGYYGGDPSDDWVVTLAGQDAVRPAVFEYRKKLRLMTIP